MKKTTFLVLGGLLGVSLVAGLGGAHSRNYAMELVFPYVISCVDDKFTVLGTGGAVGGVLNTVGATVDPVAPDTMGTCYRANHITPNANGDVTFSWIDQTQTNVGGCASQDSDGDGTLCDDAGDFQQRGCNGVTVNTNFPIANAWRFQDAQGVPAAGRTFVALNPWLRGNTVIPIGELTDCGAATDNWGTIGDISHS